MVSAKGKRQAGTAKKKSIRSKAPLGSKRRLSRFGKEQKKGHSGSAINYMTRTRALKTLQISLRDFRRLCILKGVYPRDPKKKSAGKHQTYYHLKDITYLTQEPLLAKFREFKTFMRKVRKLAGRKEIHDARVAMEDRKPEYTLDHLVKERYPQFLDSVRDIDDALCMIHMFAALPAERRIGNDKTFVCLRLCREWQQYVAMTHSLRKVFVSIKGIYYQAEIQGELVTWLVPHSFPHVLPTNVDFRVMLTFLEFHVVLLKFVFFKLYSDQGLRYPPIVDERRENAGEHLAALALEAQQHAADLGIVTRAANAKQPAEEDVDEEEGAVAAAEPDSGKSEQQKASEARIRTLGAKLRALASRAAGDDEEAAAAEPSGGEFVSALGVITNEDSSVFQGNEEMALLEEAARKRMQESRLFQGLRFYLGRETPQKWLEFTVCALAGQAMSEKAGDASSAADSSITHHIVDRPVQGHRFFNREYVQPQWVFDSVNAGMLLPTARYMPGAKLPPHLSPFVDDVKDGYIPQYREELNLLKSAKHAILDSSSQSGAAAVATSDDDGSDDAAEEQYALELKAEEAGISYSTKDAAAAQDEDSPSDSGGEEEESEEEEEGGEESPEEVIIGEDDSSEQEESGSSSDEDSGRSDYEDAAPLPKKPLTVAEAKAEKKRLKEEALQQAKAEEEALKNIMMPKKTKRLYGRMQRGIAKKAERADGLRRKRDQLEQEETKAVTSSKTSKRRRKK